jgi:lipopolysaccharide transport system permease protein
MDKINIAKQLAEVWHRKELLFEYFKVILKLQHVGSVLGFLWTLVNPLLYIVTYWVVFTFFLKMGIEKYPLFLIPGFLAWNFTLSALVNSSNSVIHSTYLITKIYFPNEILPFATVGLSLFDYIISIFLYFIIIIIIPGAFTFSFSILIFPVILITQIFLTVGLSLIVSCLAVYFRDVPNLVQVAGTIIFFLTPIFYPLNYIPEKFRIIILFNPIAQIISYYHDIFYYGRFPNIFHVSGTLIISLILFYLGLAIFGKYKSAFAELS